MRRAARLIAACTAIGLLTGSPVSAGTRSLPDVCEGARLARESKGVRGAVPVLFVHGFSGAPKDFRREIDGRASLLATIAKLDGSAVYTFDYSEHSTQWVSHQSIAPRLARAIRCLARATGHEVIVVAHSMGGLATKLAQGQVIQGRAVSEDLSRVITVGTPYRGVILLTYTGDSITAKAIQTAINAIGEVCADPEEERKHQRLCELLDAANEPATTAMAPDAGALDALPPWGEDVVVSPIAADLRLRVSVLGFGTTVSIGDIVATAASATADASRGEKPLVVRCRIGLANLPATVDRSPCSHGNELTNRRVVAAVRARVLEAIRNERSGAPAV
jgi:pimeloyl-ACP methyl ester carboxylesterase